MRTFFPKTVNEQNIFEYFGPISKGRLQQIIKKAIKKSGFLTKNFYCKCFFFLSFFCTRRPIAIGSKYSNRFSSFTVLGKKNSSLFSLLYLYYGKAVWSSSLFVSKIFRRIYFFHRMRKNKLKKNLYVNGLETPSLFLAILESFIRKFKILNLKNKYKLFEQIQWFIICSYSHY